MNRVLSEILETGATKTTNGSSTVKVHSSISASEGQLELCAEVGDGMKG